MFIPPTSITVDVSDNILLSTLQASDLKVDGLPANAVTAADGDTASFGVGFAHEYDGHYYVLTSGPMDWTQAESEAKSLGGHLVTVNSQAENDFLQKVYFSGHERDTGYWLGFNYVETEGVWVWASGEQVTYTNWYPGMPDDYDGNEDFAEINGYFPAGTWNDTNVNNYGGPFVGIIELNDLPAGYRIATEGLHSVSIAAGAVKDVQGTPIQPFASTFVLDYTAPRVESYSILQGAVLPDGYQDLDLTIGFSEAMDTRGVDVYDVTLIGQNFGSFYYPSAATFNEAGTELTISFQDVLLTEDIYNVTLTSGDFGFQDLVGLDLDGEYSGTLPSGNGLEGGDFVIHFSVDAPTRQLPVPLTAIDPLGSLIYQTPYALSGVIAPGSDTDDFTIELDANQTVTLLVGASAGLQPTVSLFDPSDNQVDSMATAPAPGSEAVFQATLIPGAGTYRITVGSAGGQGLYSVQLIVNAAVEDEQRGGPTNDTLLTAQDIEGSFIDLTTGTSRREQCWAKSRLPVPAREMFSSRALMGGSTILILAAACSRDSVIRRPADISLILNRESTTTCTWQCRSIRELASYCTWISGAMCWARLHCPAAMAISEPDWM